MKLNIFKKGRLNAYRNIPIIETTATRPVEKMSPTVTCAEAVSPVGTLVQTATYYLRVAPMTAEGEQEACDEKTVTISGATSSIKITLSVPHKNAASVPNAYAYRIYMGTSSGVTNLTLKKVVSAFTYDANYSQADGQVDANNAGIAGFDFYITSPTYDTNSVTATSALDTPFVAVGGIRPETVYLWDTDPIQGLGKMPFANTAGDQFNGLVTTKRLAEIEDYIWFLVKSYAALTPSFEATSCWMRGLRTA